MFPQDVTLIVWTVVDGQETGNAHVPGWYVESEESHGDVGALPGSDLPCTTAALVKILVGKVYG